MKKALILSLENNRVIQVEDVTFEVAEPLFWVDCPDDTTTEMFYLNGVFTKPTPILLTPTALENKATASSLLQATDWTTIAGVSDPAISNPHLANQTEFLAYRNILRNIAVYPTGGNLTWPIIPKSIWQ